VAFEKGQFLSNRLVLDESVWVAPGAVVVGDVAVGRRSSIWYGCVVRGDLEPVRIGRETNIQDLTIVHVDVDEPAVIGDRVSIGHRCAIHGCTVEDEVLVGMGSVLLNGCRVGRGSVVAAGSVVRERFEVPADMIVAGVPAEIKGPVTDDLRRRMIFGVGNYVEIAAEYLKRRLGGGPFGGPPRRAGGSVGTGKVDT
jgi:carbonic anhydrase/acetyltransferase-like protein (isoleucine patch superfamily)